jgi:Putative beta-barrel porin-2, OmpL-like. bbp2
MKSMRCINKWATAVIGLGLAVGTAPALRAQAPAQAQDASAASSSAAAPGAADTQKRLDDLQKELTELQTQIAALKAAQAAPAVKMAALTSASPSAGEMAPAPAADDAPAKISIASLLGPTTISGTVDGYYSFNFNQPSSLGNVFPDGTSGNSLRFFDNNAQQFSLNAAELVLDKAPDTSSADSRAGYHVGVIYGQAAAAINGTVFNFSSPTDSNNIALKEAYVDYIAPIGKGLTITAGKFVTPIGAEVIESNGNWNYSRSILFYYAIPYFHFGVNAKYAFNSKWAVTGYMVNGWNNTQEVNTGKTYGVSLAWTPNAKWSVTENYMAGPQDDVFFHGASGGPNSNWRQIEDATIGYTPNGKWAFLLNGDYGYGDKYGLPYPLTGNSSAVDWWGTAAYAKYTVSSKSYLALRYEYFSDPQGFELFGIGNNNGHVAEGTATYAYNLTSGLQTRFEFRDDYSNRAIFDKGGRSVFTQPIAELGFIYTFSSANAK